MINRATRRIRSGLSAACLLSLCLALILRQNHTFSQAIELPAYDTITKLTWPWKTGHQKIVLVTIQDAEDWPLTDQNLADTLHTLASAKPDVIAVDLIRDSHRIGDPLTADLEIEALENAYAKNPHLLMIDGLSTATNPGFLAPPWFQDVPPETYRNRIGLANFPRDESPALKVRRGLFATSDPDRFSLSALAATIASVSLDPENPPQQADFDKITTFLADSGGYAIPDQEIGSQFLIKFGPELDTLFPEFSMSEVQTMTAEELQKNFAGKVVFFGTGNTKTAKDEIPVIGNPELRGIKLHALVTAQLIRELTEGEPPIVTTSNTTEVLITILATILAGALLFLFRYHGIRRFLGLTLLLALIFGVSCIALKSGIWLPAGAPMAATLFCGILGSLFLHREVTQNLRTYSSTLKQQFGDQVARVIEDHREELLENGSLPKRLFNGSALFSDLLGFTAITEKYAHEEQSDEFLDWINHYLRGMVPIIRKHRGVIVKFAGDGIFVVFGFPDDSDHADRAVKCCRDMENKLNELNQNRTQETPAYFVRAGIYSGPIFAGPVGSRERLSYDFLGSTINKAARLESLEKENYQPSSDSTLPPLRTIISGPTHDLLSHREKVQPFGDSPSQIDKNLTKEEEKEQLWELIF